MTTLLSFLLAIAILVVIHELGHYWVARRCGVKVLRFSVGFGKPLYIKRYAGSETEWVISAIPLGGYVRMLDEREEAVAPEELSRAFNRKPVWQRMAIVVAGPLANLLLAVLLYWVLFLHGVPEMKPMLGEIKPATPAAIANLHTQETIVSINGEPMPGWQEVRWKLLDLALQKAAADIETVTTNGQVSHHTLDLIGLSAADLDGDFMQKLGIQTYRPPVYAIIGKLSEGGVAQRAGLQSRDLVLYAAGLPVFLWEDLVSIVREHPNTRFTLDIERNGKHLEIEVTPEGVHENGALVGKIGAAPLIDEAAFKNLLTEVRYPPQEALLQALRKTRDTIKISLKMMGKMLTGEVSIKNLSGPISIADYAGQSAQMGLTAYLGFLALISVSLGVLNLLPVPLLDGGHLLYYVAELIKGGPVSERAWEIGQKIGIGLLFTLMAFALYNDVSRLFLG
ncbi:MAG: RIP metalloprotease RseP [Nitrosomonadales bacterium]|nr:RIP metalloprotease RseP [Nitrosomonadales bacterium]